MIEFKEWPERWQIEDAIALATAVEGVVAPMGWHVALTGGMLYKGGSRKDVDLILYHHNQPNAELASASRDEIENALRGIDLDVFGVYSAVSKATYRGKAVDLLYVERRGGLTGYPEPPKDEVPF